MQQWIKIAPFEDIPKLGARVVRTKNKESAEVNNVLAQKDFLNGQLTVDQVSSVQEKYNKSVIDFETNVIKFQTDYIQLEVFTGTNLSTLIRKLQ